MKPPGTPRNDTLELDDRRWRVEFRAGVARRIIKLGLENAAFNPTIAELIALLERDPKQFPKKAGKLAKRRVRAAPLRYRGAAWRLCFVLDEARGIVDVITFEKHDAAYRSAART